MRRDPVLGAAIKQIGMCGLAARQRGDHLSALLQAIVSQQLSTKAAATIFARLVALFPGGVVASPADIDRLTDAGPSRRRLSRQKAGYIRDLAARLADGSLNLGELDTLDDELVIERLTSVKGFGRWTAEMFLMFRLHRPDVLPAGDLGIVVAMQRRTGCASALKPKRILKIGEALAAASVRGGVVSLADAQTAPSPHSSA